jgi:hypothetical protein
LIKEPRSHTGEKTNGAAKLVIYNAKSCNETLYFSSCTKINSKWVQIITYDLKLRNNSGKLFKIQA